MTQVKSQTLWLSEYCAKANIKIRLLQLLSVQAM